MKKRFLALCLTLIMIISVFSSCGAKVANDSSVVGNGKEYDYALRDEIFAPETEAPLNMGFGSTSYSKGEIVDDVFSDSAAVPEEFEEKIIKDVTIDAETKEFDEALKGVLDILAKYGGYEESVTSRGKGYNYSDYYTRYAYLVLRIPAEKLDAFLGEVGGLINVTSNSSQKSNVTEHYYDTKARIGVLESERAAYEEMLKLATTVEEVLIIKDRLYNVIEEIEANKTTLKMYDSKVSYSTVRINLSEVKEISNVPTTKTTFGERVSARFTRSWQNFADGCEDLALWLIGALPTLLVIAVIAGITLGITIPIAKKNKKEKKSNDQ